MLFCSTVADEKLLLELPVPYPELLLDLGGENPLSYLNNISIEQNVTYCL